MGPFCFHKAPLGPAYEIYQPCISPGLEGIKLFAVGCGVFVSGEMCVTVKVAPLIGTKITANFYDSNPAPHRKQKTESEPFRQAMFLYDLFVP